MDIEFKVGKRQHDPRHMTSEERVRWQKEMAEDAREYLFSIGQPLVYRKQGHIVAEHRDGRIQIIK
ncbi:MAG: hypothetical protein J7576_05660 [Siphonobacter aquaeclarae]|nr:hypothetical protein [Siphonobacter aquaeclarae]